MKLLSCLLFAGFALSANLVHADASCMSSPGFKRGSNVGALDILKDGSTQRPTTDTATAGNR